MNRRLGGDTSLNAPMREEGEGEWQDWLVDESRSQEPCWPTARRATPARRALAARCRRAQSTRAAHLRGAPAGRRPDHARAAVGRVRRLARARAADRGSGLRKGAVPPSKPRLARIEALPPAGLPALPKAPGALSASASPSRGAANPSLSSSGRFSSRPDVRKDLVARRALFEGDLRSPAVGEEHRNVEPLRVRRRSRLRSSEVSRIRPIRKYYRRSSRDSGEGSPVGMSGCAHLRQVDLFDLAERRCRRAAVNLTSSCARRELRVGVAPDLH